MHKDTRDGLSKFSSIVVVDSAVRKVMEKAGFGSPLSMGLDFSFQAINYVAAPVLHPASNEVMHNGMVHNMETAVYLEGKGGIRLNDNVLVRSNGKEVLSSKIPRDLNWLAVIE